MIFGNIFLILTAALLIDAVFGDPPRLYRRVPHPAALMGACIGVLDRALNRDALAGVLRKGLGAISILGLLAATWIIGDWVSKLLALVPLGWLAEALILSTLIAQNSLYRHVAAVASALEQDGLAAAREAVSQIVGRDTGAMDEAGASRSAIESLAENFSDGVVAPVLWAALFGLPGILAYKMLNTADSMIGHRTPRHSNFGWAAARLDDAANFIPARISALVITIAALFRREHQAMEAAHITGRDGRRHRSVNAGYPEAAFAGALGVKLSGPREYEGALSDEPWIGAGQIDVSAVHIRAALRLYVNCCLLLGAVFAFAALATL
ncbi:MAG: cobalamin biosynthesis protein CobD [Rhodospirillales bacterium]|nr:cobalamin biosynthesis protein CobD [Rhodospirillales bacterium]